MNLSLNPSRKILTEIVPTVRTEHRRLYMVSPHITATGNNTFIVSDVSLPHLHIINIHEPFQYRWDDISFTITECISDCHEFFRWLARFTSRKRLQARSFFFRQVYDDCVPKPGGFIVYGCTIKHVTQFPEGIHVILSINSCLSAERL